MELQKTFFVAVRASSPIFAEQKLEVSLLLGNGAKETSSVSK
jgi:hypothetical protein